MSDLAPDSPADSPLPDIAARLAEIRQRLAAAAVVAGRSPDDVRLVAVTKTFPVAAALAAYAADQRVFGENRVEELAGKRPVLPVDALWHMIGHLQSRKAADAVAVADLIHSVDSTKLLRRIAAAATALGKVQGVLLQLNISGEASKSGLPPADADACLADALTCPGIEVRGLMTMAPLDANEAELHRVFAGLRQTRDRLAASFGVALPELSMGMSGDFAVAVAEGATLVRIGSAIFGHRA